MRTALVLRIHAYEMFVIVVEMQNALVKQIYATRAYANVVIIQNALKPNIVILVTAKVCYGQ